MKRSKVLFSALSAAFIGAAMLSTPATADAPREFNKCKACHLVEAGKHRAGPSLAGVYGRQAGTAEGFTKYRGLKGADWTWDSESLDAYLQDPRGYTKERTGTTGSMAINERDPEKRAVIIEYLKTL